MSLFFNLPMVISIGSHGLTSIVFVFRGGLWWWILLSLYPLTSTSVSVSSSELPEDSSVETWSFIFFREKQIASNCSSEGSGFDWSINGSLAFAFASSDDFSCLRDPENPLAFIFFLQRLRFFFQSFSTKGILYLTRSMIWYIQQTYSILKCIP